MGGDVAISRTKFTHIALPGEEGSSSSTSSNNSTKPPIAVRMGQTRPPTSSSPSSSSSSSGDGWSVGNCRPEETSVSLGSHFEPHIIHFPRCVRVDRCGGCCSTELLACEPSEISQVEVPVSLFC